MIWFSSSVGLMLVVVIGLVVVKLAGRDEPAHADTSSALASATVLAAVATVPSAVLDTVGAGTSATRPTKVSGQPVLTSGGKPLIVYLGAEYCPYCAAQRWSVVVALSRFGHVTGLGATASAGEDVFPNTATVSFHGATYVSDYLEFQGVEMQSNVRTGSSYAVLDTPTAQQRGLMETFNAPPYVDAASAGAIPFIDFGNQYVSAGASYSPQVLAGLSAEDIAAALSDPASPVAKAVLGAANVMTAALCRLTGNKPSAVCTGTAVASVAGTW